MKQERGTQAGGCSSAVERVLRMYEAPGSTPGSSTRAFFLHYYVVPAAWDLVPPGTRAFSKKRGRRRHGRKVA